MTRPTKSLLVLDGSEVKLKLLAERQASKSVVHIDWVRFTVLRRNVPALSAKVLFHPDTNIWDEGLRMSRLNEVLREIPDCDFTASAQAYDLAAEAAVCLGAGYAVNPEIKKGHDFYRFRWCIERNGVECGWVGFLASGDSPRQTSQSGTIHCNLFGAACTFAAFGWNDRLASMVEARDGVLTRCDLALDFFDGLPGGIESIKADYMAGLCDVGGKRLKCNMVGDWCNGQERSFYFGSKEAGKQTNAYEKGDQLFGAASNSEWLRVELRYGNKLRVLSADMLRRPSDFFAGASPWHALMLLRADAIAEPEKVKTTGRLPLETVKAECVRSVRWFLNTAMPTVATLFRLGGDSVIDLLALDARPGRLSKFSLSEISKGLSDVLDKVSSVESCPAFA